MAAKIGIVVEDLPPVGVYGDVRGHAVRARQQARRIALSSLTVMGLYTQPAPDGEQ